MFYHLFVLVLFIFSVNGASVEVDPLKSKVYGPGLAPDNIVFPVRYFFIEVYDTSGERVRESVGSPFSVQVEGDTEAGTYCRVWTQVLDRYDGSYIVRYRTYHTCRNTRINVLYRSQHVADSPYKIEGPFYSEDCYCPLPDVSSWLEAAECPPTPSQILEDLKPFPSVRFDDVLREAKARYHQPLARSFCHYVIKSNEIYRQCYGKHINFNMFMDNILLSMARKMMLPDTEFIINLGDWPLMDKKSTLLPIFSWCGSEDTADIVLPTYDLTESTLEMMGRVTLDLLSVQSNNAVPWSAKKPVAFWRGRDSRQERLDLVALARKNTELFNVSLTNFFFFRDQEEEYGPKEKHVSFFDFFNYKYQLNIDGTVAAYRLSYLLGGSGVVLKQESPYYEHFYSLLKPNVHYLPFKRDLSDLVEKVLWAREHDQEMAAMGAAGRQLVQDSLMPRDIFCYHALLLQEWTKRLESKVIIKPGMEHVPRQHNEKRFGDCKCHRLGQHDEL